MLESEDFMLGKVLPLKYFQPPTKLCFFQVWGALHKYLVGARRPLRNSVNDASAIVWLCIPIVCFSILCGSDLAWLYFHISCHGMWFSMSCQKSSHPRSQPYSTIIKWLLKRYKESMWGSWIYISCNFCMISPFASYFYIYRAVCLVEKARQLMCKGWRWVKRRKCQQQGKITVQTSP